MDVTEIRRGNLRALAKKENLGTNRLADKLGKTPSYIGQIIGRSPRRGIGNTLAREIEDKFGYPRGWMDQPHSLDAMEPETMIRAVTLVEGALRAEKITITDEKKARLYLEVYKRLQTATLDLADVRSLVLLAA